MLDDLGIDVNYNSLSQNLQEGETLWIKMLSETLNLDSQFSPVFDEYKIRIRCEVAVSMWWWYQDYETDRINLARNSEEKRRIINNWGDTQGEFPRCFIAAFREVDMIISIRSFIVLPDMAVSMLASSSIWSWGDSIFQSQLIQFKFP